MRRVSFLCLFIMILLGGCEKHQIPLTSDAPSGSKEPKATPGATQQIQKQKSQDVVEQLKRQSKTGWVAAFVQGESSLFFVQNGDGKDIVFCLDIETGEFKQKELPLVLGKRIEMQHTESYTVIYDDNRNVIVLDSGLNLVRQLRIKKKLLDGWNRNYCVLPRAKKIVYTRDVRENGEWYQEINECNYAGKKNRQICRLIDNPQKSFGKTNELTDLFVPEDETALFFQGLYYTTADRDSPNAPCFGKVDRTSGDIVSVQEEKGRSLGFGNAMVFADGLQERGVVPSGYITCLDTQGNESRHTFRRKEESQEVAVSDRGTYYLSYETDDDEGTTDVSCYSFDQSAFQWERHLRHYVSDLWYFEQERMLLYTYYDDDMHLHFGKEELDE